MTPGTTVILLYKEAMKRVDQLVMTVAVEAVGVAASSTTGTNSTSTVMEGRPTNVGFMNMYRESSIDLRNASESLGLQSVATRRTVSVTRTAPEMTLIRSRS